MATTTDRLTLAWANQPGVMGWLTALNHRTIGTRFIVTAFAFFIIGGLQALAIRVQLVRPNNDFMSPQAYNEFFTMHGTTMMFLFAVPMAEAFAMYLLPLMLGTRDMPYPRLNAFGYFCFLFGGVFLYLSFVTGDVPDSGWFSYVPLSGPEFSPGVNLDFWLLGITFVEVAAVAAAIEIIVIVFKFRAPGMTLGRIPLFVWNIVAVAFMILFAFPALIAASVMLEADRALGLHIYNSAMGGDPILWQHLFWFFGHPEVYIIFLPAAGFVSMIIPVFSRRPIVGYTLVALAAVATAFLSFGLWVHHMFATGLPRLAMAFFTGASLAIAIPSGIQVFAWIGTIWAGRPVINTAMLFMLGFLFIFVAGGITGVMVAIIPFDLQVHDSFFVVAHFHYVLIGGMVFPLFGAFYYWLPKMTGRLLDERLGLVNFWTFFAGFNLTFFPMHIMGLLGMPRRVYTYQPELGWDTLNLVSTIGAFVLAFSALVFIWNFLRSLSHGKPAGENPWGGNTLEWATASPPEPYNFRRVPVVVSRNPLWDQDDLYDYSPGAEPVLDLSQAPDGTRQILMTTAFEAEPERVITIPAFSIWPLIVSLGLAAFFTGVLLSLYGLSLAGILVTLLGTAAWHWPPSPDENPTTPPESRERDLRQSASRVTAQNGWWGMMLLLVTIGVTFGSVVFAYFLLWSRADHWPFGGLPAPDFLLPPFLTICVLLGFGASFMARRFNAPDSRKRLGLLSLVACGAGALFVALTVTELLRQDFSATTNAYGSIFFSIHVFQALNVALATTISGWVFVRLLDSRAATLDRASVENGALTWGFAAGTWAVTFGVLYLVPFLGAPAVRL